MKMLSWTLMLDQAQISLGESQGTCPIRVEIFKGLLRNVVNKGNLDRGEKMRKRKERVKKPLAEGWEYLDGYLKMG